MASAERSSEEWDRINCTADELQFLLPIEMSELPIRLEKTSLREESNSTGEAGDAAEERK
ncbi:hypothetical protein KFK09_008862 [Dendrobium nobile]|uniref:Uncharacterized protein n=1 Tax=Dendrobium nobile TaxID=94219 RepID=A0A8T3BR47_DENNO|nr:hypothetical protein KFK09_008862 [Dendrobium nobile]